MRAEELTMLRYPAVRYLIICLCTLVFPSIGRAQAIQSVLHDAHNSAELKDYYRERLIDIQITVTEIKSKKEVVFHGTGFIVSPAGDVITARHVIDAANSPDKYLVTRPDYFKIFLHEHGLHVPTLLKFEPKTFAFSERADIATFKVSANDGGTPYKYMCIDRADPRLNTNELLTMASFRNISGQTDLTFKENASISHPAGPNEMYRYVGVDKVIEASMSGGAVVRNKTDRVIAVMSDVLAIGDQEQRGENYANLLQAATDIGLDAVDREDPCPPPVPDGLDLKPAKSQTEFMSNTCEGTVAWLPESEGSSYWYFKQSGNYSLRRKDLAACKEGDGWKNVHFIINTSSKGSCPLGKPISDIPNTAVTFYGVQVVPVYRRSAINSTTPETWFYKNATLFARKSNGNFYTPREQKPRDPETLENITPSDFNDAITHAVSLFDQTNRGCTSISAGACSDIAAVGNFAKQMKPWGLKNSWHGYSRNDPDSESTLKIGGKPYWLVPPGWIVDGKDKQDKNWILRYSGTSETRTSKPLDFSFCIEPEWKEFFLRTFSRERNVKPEVVHVYIID
jgi:hypothetical protein